MTERTAVYLTDRHIHELMDRVSVSQEYIENSLMEHSLTRAVPDIESIIDTITHSLAELYQELGQYQRISDIEKAHQLRTVCP